MRNNLEAQLGEKLFLIADARDRASEISFYLRDKSVEGPGHPPVYIPESQDMVNQFSFWPRYDEFVELNPARRDQRVKRTPKRTALTPSSAVMLSLFGAARRTTCRIVSGL